MIEYYSLLHAEKDRPSQLYNSFRRHFDASFLLLTPYVALVPAITEWPTLQNGEL